MLKHSDIQPDLFSQPEIETSSPINKEKLKRCNKDVYDHLKRGERINRVVAKNLYKVGNLHSRIPEVNKVLKEEGIELQRRFIKIMIDGEETHIREYWIE